MDKTYEALEEVKKMSANRRQAVMPAIYPAMGSPGFDMLLKALREGDSPDENQASDESKQ